MRDCNDVQMEAGPVLCGALFAAGLVDELPLYIECLPMLHLPTLTDIAGRWRVAPGRTRQAGDD
jgi:diaminohydroxyphosphoribosylaminopyrimidine deaminase/5-amino-6-(5-phosphoribosylamino)uracil reductase